MRNNWPGIAGFFQKTKAVVTRPVASLQRQKFLPGRYEMGEVSLLVFCIRPPELIKNDKVIGSVVDNTLVFTCPITPEQLNKFNEAWADWKIHRRFVRYIGS